jgi:hypothetical protein
MFSVVADAVRADRGLRCGCAEPQWDDRVVRQNDESVTLSHHCPACGFTAETTLSLERVKELARTALQQNER